MQTEEYKALTARREYIAAGSEAHRFMTDAAREAQRITAQINGAYHSAEELRALFSELTGERVDDSFGLFPPFYTDFGRNIRVGKGVFINSGCCFQDQGGIELGDGCLIGHQVVIATLNHDFDPTKRGGMYPAPVRLGNNVWVGARMRPSLQASRWGTTPSWRRARSSRKTCLQTRSWAGCPPASLR